jgi:O-antigen/teichoic acid export membrane protein
MSSNPEIPKLSSLGNLLRSSVRQSSIYFLGTAGVSLIQFLLIPVYARIFEPAEYGVLSLSLLLISVSAAIFGNWLSNCVTRFLPYYQRTDETHLFYSTLVLSLILSVIVFLLLAIPASLVLRGFIDVNHREVIPLIVVLVPLNVMFQLFLSILRIKLQSRKFVAYNLAFYLVGYTLGVMLAVFLHLGIAGILLGQTIVLAILAVIMFRGTIPRPVKVSLKASSIPVIREFALYGFPAAASTVGTWILSASDRYVIGFYRGTSEVGLYSMGYNIGNIILIMVQAFSLAMVPSLLITYESDNREMTPRLLSELTRVFFLVALPAAVGISVLAQPIIGLMTTEAYYTSSRVVPIIALGNFTYGLSSLAYIGLITAKKSHIMARNWFIAGALNILLNVILVPHFGYTIAAVNFFVSNIVLLLLNITSANKYLKWTVMPKTVLNICLASFIMAGVVFVVIKSSDSHVIKCVAGVIAGIMAYSAMLLVLKEFSRGEILEITSLVKRIIFWSRRTK